MWRSVRSITSAGLLLVFYAAGCAGADAKQVRLSDDFAGTDGFVASEPQPAAGSPWTMTSGTLYRSEGAGWSGSPDPGGAPGLNGSAVFRMVSVNRGFTNIDLTLRLDVESREVVNLSQNPSSDTAPAWSPDGLQIVFVSKRDLPGMLYGGDIFVMDADGGNVRKLTQSDGRCESPSWSPDGRTIAYVTDRSGIVSIHLMDPMGELDLNATAGEPQLDSYHEGVRWQPR